MNLAAIRALLGLAPWRLIGAGAVILAAFAAGHHLATLQQAKRAEKAATAHLQALAAKDVQNAREQREYVEEQARLRADLAGALARGKPIRLRLPACGPAAATGGSHAGAGAGQPEPGAGPLERDLEEHRRGELADAGRADEVAARLAALQGWVRANCGAQ